MAFTKDSPACTDDERQHLNLSIQAYAVIENDMFTFHETTRSHFISRISQYYYPVAEASVSRMLNIREGELDQLLSWMDQKEVKKTKKRVIQDLLQQEEDRLIQKAGSYGKGKSVKIHLNKKSRQYLTEAESECGEEKYYPSRGKYIKSVLEEYARLPYVQREQIYFSDFLEKIQNAIQAKPSHQLRVETSSGTVYSVYPYDVLCDPLSTANYLVGYSRRYGHPEGDLHPCSFRISAMVSIKEEKSKRAFLKEDLRNSLAKIIASRGVQFMSTEEKEIQVRLSAAGQAKYQRHMHLRPALDRKAGPDKDIFVFHCTAMQAEFYFFKFGADAEILQPASLRERFIELHRDALNVYLTAKENAPYRSQNE